MAQSLGAPWPYRVAEDVFREIARHASGYQGLSYAMLIPNGLIWQREGPPVATRILVDGRAAPNHTVVEVVTRDRPGLLFALSHAIYSVGLSIALAKIATEGSRVVDVFYVTDAEGRKLAPEARAGVEAALLFALGVQRGRES